MNAGMGVLLSCTGKALITVPCQLNWAMSAFQCRKFSHTSGKREAESVVIYSGKKLDSRIRLLGRAIAALPSSHKAMYAFRPAPQ